MCMVLIFQMASASQWNRKWNEIKELLHLKKPYENTLFANTLFANTKNKHIWDIILAFLEDGRKERRPYMTLTKPMGTIYYEQTILAAYNEFEQELQIHKNKDDAFSKAIKILKYHPFGFWIFDSPCPTPLCENIDYITWNGGFDAGFPEFFSTHFTSISLPQEWFPPEGGFMKTAIRYNYTKKLLEVCNWKNMHHGYRYLFREEVYLPIVFYAKESGEEYFFHLPSSFRKFSLQNRNNSTCELLLQFREYSKPRSSLRITIDLLCVSCPVEFALCNGQDECFKLHNLSYLQRIYKNKL